MWKKSANLKLETLEQRANPTSMAMNGWIYITGTAGIDNVSVTMEGSNYKVLDNGVVTLYTPAQAYAKNVKFQGLAGNDTFSNNTALNSYAYGDDGADYLLGGSGKDFMVGGNGNDVICGAANNDQLYGGNGMDYLYGNDGNDILDGGDDRFKDYLAGGTGSDLYQQDLVWNGMAWINQDKAQDFAGQDGYYNQ